jgi:hypothetical protein
MNGKKEETSGVLRELKSIRLWRIHYWLLPSGKIRIRRKWDPVVREPLRRAWGKITEQWKNHIDNYNNKGMRSVHNKEMRDNDE